MKFNISRIWKKAQSSGTLTNEKLLENPISTLALTDEDLATVDGACLGGFGGGYGFNGFGGYGCNEGFGGGYGFNGFGGYGCNEGFGGGYGCNSFGGYGFRGGCY